MFIKSVSTEGIKKITIIDFVSASVQQNTKLSSNFIIINRTISIFGNKHTLLSILITKDTFDVL